MSGLTTPSSFKRVFVGDDDSYATRVPAADLFHVAGPYGPIFRVSSTATVDTTLFGAGSANYVTFIGSAETGVFDTSAPAFQAEGAGTHIDVEVLGKGTNGRLSTKKLYVGAGSLRFASADATVAYVRTDMNSSTTFAPGMRIGGAVSGTVTSGQAFLCQIAVDADTLDPMAAGGPQGMHTLYVGHTVSAGAKGGRTAISSALNINGAMTADGAGGNGSFLVAAGFFAAASAGASGTAGAGNERGNLFGINTSAKLNTGAGAYWNSLVGVEINVGSVTGTGIAYKIGLQIIQWPDDTVAGTVGVDAGLMFAYGGLATAPVGWDIGITFGHPFGQWPVKPGGTLIGTKSTLFGGLSYAAAFGVDFSSVTFSTAAFKSNGFLVDGSGNTTAPTFKVGSNQVVAARQTGWTAATGTATRTTFDTATVTLPQLAERVKAALDNLITHGLIGT